MAVEDLSLGRLLRRHRAVADLSQEELAERAGISARTVSDVERGMRGAVYPDTAERLAEALRLEGEERAVFESAARGRRRKLPGDGSGAPAAPVTPAAIRVPPTALIGRERELEVILAALRSPNVRLITLSGPGGIGKTRLALEAAEISQTEFEDGAFLVSLAANRDPNLVVPIIAHAVGLRHAGEPLKDALLEHLRERRALLLLDTFEQVLDAAPLIGDLVASCPLVTVLVTSRAALHLRGEREVALMPLELPDDTRNLSPDDLKRSSAVALFMERAVTVKPVCSSTRPRRRS